MTPKEATEEKVKKATIDFMFKRMWWGKTIDKMVATTGYDAHSAKTGNYAHSATTGYEAHSATTGYKAHSATTGNYAHSATTGKNSISAGLGFKNLAKATLCSWIVLCEWEQDTDFNWNIKSVQSVQVDGEKIKADTFYKLENGEFVEVTE